jgi:hypothetical protein
VGSVRSLAMPIVRSSTVGAPGTFAALFETGANALPTFANVSTFANSFERNEEPCSSWWAYVTSAFSFAISTSLGQSFAQPLQPMQRSITSVTNSSSVRSSGRSPLIA